MSVQTLTDIRLGHGGGAYLNGVYVPATGGSMDNSVSVQYQSGYLMGSDSTSRSRILHSDGTVTHSGSVSFDLTTSSLSVVSNIIRTRGLDFNVKLMDGAFSREMTNCYATSITLSGSPSGVLNGTVNFMGPTPSIPDNNILEPNARDSFTDGLIPYWWSGNSYVRDWTLTYNQNIVPKFCNKTSGFYNMISDGIAAVSPTYLFVGEIDVTIDFTTFCPLASDNVNISTNNFKIVGRTTSSGYNMGGSNDLGTYKYSITSHASLKNSTTIFQ